MSDDFCDKHQMYVSVLSPCVGCKDELLEGFLEDNVRLENKIKELERQVNFWLESSKEWSTNCLNMKKQNDIIMGVLSHILDHRDMELVIEGGYPTGLPFHSRTDIIGMIENAFLKIGRLNAQNTDR